MDTITFKQQAETFLREAQNRKRRPFKQRTMTAYRSYLNHQILPLLGDMDLSLVGNKTAKDFIAHLRNEKLSDSSIAGIFAVVKMVVSSATDAEGNELYPVRWNNDYIDLPVVNARTQKAPTTSAAAIERALGRANGPYKALIALMAGSGLRIGEALALMVGPDDGKNSFWIPESGMCVIRTTLVNGQIQDSPKTEAGNRTVDLAPELNDFLCQLLLDSELPQTGLLFTSKTGGTVCLKTAYDKLKEAGIVGGFHTFRRFHCTHLDNSQVPRGLAMFRIGHAAKDVHDRYVKNNTDTQARKMWAEKAGLGFQLEAS